MRVLCVAHRICSRTQKQLIALGGIMDVHLVTNMIPTANVFKSVNYYQDVNGLRSALELFKDVDIVHCVSEPSWVLFAVKNVLGDKKVILDIHDAQIWRSEKPEDASNEERLAFNWADGLIVPSQPCKEILALEQPTIVLPPYCNEQDINYGSWAYLGGIVYQGRVDVPDFLEFMNYCKYVDTCKEFEKAGLPFHIYTPLSDSEEHRNVYKDICRWHDKLPYSQLLKQLSLHDWGLCGNINPTREWDIAMPNKLFEYMAAGIPIIALNAKEVGECIERVGIGISVNSIAEIKERWDERDACQRRVIELRHDYTMEKHIGEVKELYKEVLQGSLSES